MGQGQTPEEKARETIDKLLTEAGWSVQSRAEANVSAARGVAICEFPLKSGYGEADYLLYVDGIPAGVVEAKKEGETLTSHEIQTEKYSVGLPDELKPYRKPLPFCYQSTGIETRFTNLLEPDAQPPSFFVSPARDLRRVAGRRSKMSGLKPQSPSKASSAAH